MSKSDREGRTHRGKPLPVDDEERSEGKITALKLQLVCSSGTASNIERIEHALHHDCYSVPVHADDDLFCLTGQYAYSSIPTWHV